MGSEQFPNSRIVSREWDYDQMQTARFFAQYVGVPVRWLTEAKAKNAHAYVDRYLHNFGMELNPAAVEAIERHKFIPRTIADAWLKTRFSAAGSVQLLFPRNQSCVVDSPRFLAHWQAIVHRGAQAALHNLGPQILLTAHAPCQLDTLEFGLRKAHQQACAQ